MSHELLIGADTPAFPLTIAEDSETFIYHGVTVRDYFAAAALTGLLNRSMTKEEWPRNFARWAYEAADAMLEARGA